MSFSRHHFILEILEGRRLFSAGPVNAQPLNDLAARVAVGFAPAVPVSPVMGPYAPAVSAGESPADGLSPSGALLGDANCDGAVNGLDFDALKAFWNKPGSWWEGDFNGDGVVNFADFVLFSNNAGRSQPPNVYDNREILASDGYTDVYYAGPADGGPMTTPIFPIPIDVAPHPNEALQSHGADCWLIAAARELALEQPGLIENAIQPDAGGGVVVTLDHYRVHESAALPGWIAKDMPTWSYLIEKAYTGYRYSFQKNTYASLDYGNPVEVFWAFGMHDSTYITSFSKTPAQEFAQIEAALAADEPVVALTNASGTPDLVANHAYAVFAAYSSGDGTEFLTLSNPWGFDPNGYGDISVTAFMSNVTYTAVGVL